MLVIPEQSNNLQEQKEKKTDLSKTRTSRSDEDAAANSSKNARNSRARVRMATGTASPDAAAARAKAAAERAGQPPVQKVETYQRKEAKIGRNDPCPCGSGKKYKHCCQNKPQRLVK